MKSFIRILKDFLHTLYYMQRDSYKSQIMFPMWHIPTKNFSYPVISLTSITEKVHRLYNEAEWPVTGYMQMMGWE